jgi:hypothetical protein
MLQKPKEDRLCQAVVIKSGPGGFFEVVGPFEDLGAAQRNALEFNQDAFAESEGYSAQAEELCDPSVILVQWSSPEGFRLRCSMKRDAEIGAMVAAHFGDGVLAGD